MRKLIYILLFTTTALFTRCSKETDFSPPVNNVRIKLYHDMFGSRVVDGDNLASERVIKNLSIFFTEPSSNAITDKYINAGYEDINDYRLVTLPIELGTLNRKDIYVVVNYLGNASLNSIKTIDELRTKTTPPADKNSPIRPENGLCMFGKLYDFDFNNETHSPAEVYAVRTCAKIRVNLTFPDNPALSTDNGFVITGAAKYTYIVDKTGNTIPDDAYYSFPDFIPLDNNGNNVYTNLAYVYEAAKAPKIHIRTRMNGSNDYQEVSAFLPVPQRNRLYDLDVRIYEDRTRAAGPMPAYRASLSFRDHGGDTVEQELVFSQE